MAVAEALQAEPIEGLRVLLASCGAEEVLQGGVYGFVDRHLKPLDPDRTLVLNIDTVGSPRLIMLEGEGPVVMEDYCGPDFRDLVARVAEDAGVELRRGMRARTSTDAVIPSHAGYPTATLASMTAWKGLSNYHKPTDTPENVDYSTVEQAAHARGGRYAGARSLVTGGKSGSRFSTKLCDALDEVRPLEGLEHQLVRLVRGGRQPALEIGIDLLLHRGHARGRGEGRKLARVRDRLVQHLVRGQRAVGQTQLGGLGAEDDAAREEQVHRRRRPDEPGQDPRHPVLGN